MKTREFEVPTAIIAEFASLLVDHELDNEIMGIGEGGSIVIEVRYQQRDKAGLFALIELLDDYNGNTEE